MKVNEPEIDNPAGSGLWIEPIRTKIHPGEEIPVVVRAEDIENTPDEQSDPRWWTYVISPSGKRLYLPRESLDTHQELSFLPREIGCYTIIAGYNAGVFTKLPSGEFCRGTRKQYKSGVSAGYYFLYAKTNVNVGESFQKPAYAACDLEICTSAIDLDTIHVAVHYAGKPLSHACVMIRNHMNQDSNYPSEITLDSFGKGDVYLPHQHEWVLMVTHTDFSRSITGLYDYTHFTSTLSLPSYDDQG